MVEPIISKPLVLSDLDDDAALYTAADGKSDVLRTRSIRHFEVPAVRSLCSAHGIRLMTDLEVLRDVFG